MLCGYPVFLSSPMEVWCVMFNSKTDKRFSFSGCLLKSTCYLIVHLSDGVLKSWRQGCSNRNRPCESSETGRRIKHCCNSSSWCNWVSRSWRAGEVYSSLPSEHLHTGRPNTKPSTETLPEAVLSCPIPTVYPSSVESKSAIFSPPPPSSTPPPTFQLCKFA